MKTSLVLTLPVLLFSTAVVACSDAEQEGVATPTDESHWLAWSRFAD